MRVAVTGATGLIGRALASALAQRGDTVVALSREAGRARRLLGADVEIHEWREPTAEPPPAAALDEADAVLHLLGEPVAQRWSPQVKQRIHDSRVLSTQLLVAAIDARPPAGRPGVLVSQSAVGYYGPHGEEPVDEATPPGTDFLAQVTVEWEQAAQRAPEGTRVVITRTGVVLAAGAGALAQMLPPFRLGLGGPVAGGHQFVPWVHLEDTVGALLHVLGDPRATGPVNVTAPHPVSNRELAKTLGRVLRRPAVIPVPGAAVKLLFGELADSVTTGQRAVPARLLELGYEFAFPDLEPALADLL